MKQMKGSAGFMIRLARGLFSASICGVAGKPGIELEGAASEFSYSCRAVEKAKEGGLWELKTKIMNQVD
jgi:hypothetical protein